MYIIIGFLVVLVLVIIDQVTKLIALNYLKPIGSVEIIEGFFSFTFVENRGAAFGILQGALVFFIVSTIIVLGFIFYYYIKLPKDKANNFLRGSLILISAGAIGNFIDRFFRGYVVDFLQITFIDFPVFNFADMYVVTGTFLLIIIMLFFMSDEETKNKKSDRIFENSENLEEV